MSDELESIWAKGCRDADLKPDQQKKFAAMARSRFHAFQMGIKHAEEKTDEAAAGSLMSGLAVELHESPGLKNLWFRMAVSSTETGAQVSLLLEKLEQTHVH